MVRKGRSWAITLSSFHSDPVQVQQVGHSQGCRPPMCSPSEPRAGADDRAIGGSVRRQVGLKVVGKAEKSRPRRPRRDRLAALLGTYLDEADQFEPGMAELAPGWVSGRHCCESLIEPPDS